jgi:hypothetical protein
VEVDWVSGGEVVHVDAALFSASDWKPAWLLLLPALNWAKDAWRSVCAVCAVCSFSWPR